MSRKYLGGFPQSGKTSRRISAVATCTGFDHFGKNLQFARCVPITSGFGELGTKCVERRVALQKRVGHGIVQGLFVGGSHLLVHDETVMDRLGFLGHDFMVPLYQRCLNLLASFEDRLHLLDQQAAKLGRQLRTDVGIVIVLRARNREQAEYQHYHRECGYHSFHHIRLRYQRVHRGNFVATESNS